MKVSRFDAYRAIDSERSYQEQRFGPGRDLTIGEFILLAEEYICLAASLWVRETKPETGALHIMRKVAGIAVACMEQHGAPLRNACVDVFHGDDDSREPEGGYIVPPGIDDKVREAAKRMAESYEQDTEDMEAAARGPGRQNPEPWQDAVEAWLTGDAGEAELDVTWNPGDHLIEVTHLGSDGPEFIVKTGKSSVRVMHHRAGPRINT